MAWGVAAVACYVPTAIGQALLAEGGRDGAHLRTQVRLAIVVAGGLMVVGAAIATLGRDLIVTLYGEEYQEAADILPALVVAADPLGGHVRVPHRGPRAAPQRAPPCSSPSCCRPRSSCPRSCSCPRTGSTGPPPPSSSATSSRPSSPSAPTCRSAARPTAPIPATSPDDFEPEDAIALTPEPAHVTPVSSLPPPPPPPWAHPDPPADPWATGAGDPWAVARADAAASRDRPWLVPLGVAIGVVFLAGIVGACVIVSGDDGPSHPDEWDPRVADLAAFVEDERGLDFDHPVYVDFLTAGASTRRQTTDDDGRRRGRRAGRATTDYAGQLRALGVASGELDLYEAFNSVVDSGTLAFYDPTDERIRVRGTEMTVGLEVTLVHELTHALQDQHFDLERLNDPDARQRRVDGVPRPGRG